MANQKTDKKEIIQKAGYLFRTQGYHRTSMKDIADACNLLKGSIYHYFDSKQDLARSVLIDVHLYFNEQIFIPVYDRERPLKLRVNQYIQSIEAFFLTREGGCIMGNFALEVLGTEKELSFSIKQYFSDWNKALAFLFKEKYDNLIALELSAEYLSRTQGAIMLYQIHKDPELITNIGRDFKNKLLK